MKTVKCKDCGWTRKTTSDPKAVLAGHGGQCPKRKAGPTRKREVKWKDWRTQETPYQAMTPREVHELKLKQRGTRG